MKSWIKILTGIAILGIIAAVLVYIFVYNKPHPDYENLKPQFSLTAQALYDEFKADKGTAGQKYNGKMVEIKGALSRVEESDSMTTVVFVFSQGDFGDEGIRCSVLPDQRERARKLQGGTGVKIKGVCNGFTNDVILEQCTIE